MTGVEIAAGALATWVWRRARRAGETSTEQLDEAIDVGIKKVFTIVTEKLGSDPSLERLEAEAVEGETQPSVSSRTMRRVADAIADAAEDDTDFAQRLAAAVADLPDRATNVQIVAPTGNATVNAPMNGNVINFYRQ